MTTNGVFSGDSYESNPPAYYEGWLSRQVIQQGEYKIYAHLWTAPLDHQTYLDVAYRFGPSESFSYLYASNPEILTFAQRLEDDPTPSLVEADAGVYGNFKWVATWDVGSSSPLQVPAQSEAYPSSAPGRSEGLSGSALLEMLTVGAARGNSGSAPTAAARLGDVLRHPNGPGGN